MARVPLERVTAPAWLNPPPIKPEPVPLHPNVIPFPTPEERIGRDGLVTFETREQRIVLQIGTQRKQFDILTRVVALGSAVGCRRAPVIPIRRTSTSVISTRSTSD